MNSDVEALWEECKDGIYRYVYRHVNHRETTEDIVQNVFLRAWTAQLEGKSYTEHAKGWLFRIAHNLVIDHYRICQRNPDAIPLDSFLEYGDEGEGGRPQIEILAAHDPTPHEAYEKSTVKKQVRTALNRLPGTQGLVLGMRMDGYEFEEMADIFDISVGAVKALQHRGRVQLGEWLRDAA